MTTGETLFRITPNPNFPKANKTATQVAETLTVINDNEAKQLCQSLKNQTEFRKKNMISAEAKKRNATPEALLLALRMYKIIASQNQLANRAINSMMLGVSNSQHHGSNYLKYSYQTTI